MQILAQKFYIELKTIFRTYSDKYALAMILILMISLVYAFHARNKPPNSDERASLVIALGRHPSMTTEKGTPIVFEDYVDSLEYGKYPVSEIRFNRTVHSVLSDNSNGLIYYLMLTVWIKLFGIQIFWIRFLTIVMAAVNLMLIYNLAIRMEIRKWLCLLCILQIAVNPVFCEDALLIRSYMLSLTGCLLSAICLYRTYRMESPPGRYVLFYFLGIILAAGSHYYSISILGGLTIFFVWNRKKFFLPAFAWGYIALFILAGSWLWFIYPSGFKNLNFFYQRFFVISKGTGYSLTFLNAARQLLLYSATMFGFTSGMKVTGIILKIGSGVLIAVLIRGMYLLRGDFRYRFLFTLTVVPLILFLLQSLGVGNFFNFIPHYLIFFIPFWCLLLYLEIESRGVSAPASNK